MYILPLLCSHPYLLTNLFVARHTLSGDLRCTKCSYNIECPAFILYYVLRLKFCKLYYIVCIISTIALYYVQIFVTFV